MYLQPRDFGSSFADIVADKFKPKRGKCQLLIFRALKSDWSERTLTY